MPSSDLANAMARKVGMVQPLELVAAGTIDYVTVDGREYTYRPDGSRRYLA